MNPPTHVRIKQFNREIRVPIISSDCYDELMRVEPSVDRELEYRPCEVELRDGRVMDRVYLVEAVTFALMWGAVLDDSGKQYLSILDVVHIRDSPTRLPVRLANILYERGETNMGGVVFSIVMKDGRKARGSTGNAVDFIDYPLGVQPSDVIDVLHGKQDGSESFSLATYTWCLYSLPPDKAREKLGHLEAAFRNWRLEWSF